MKKIILEVYAFIASISALFVYPQIRNYAPI